MQEENKQINHKQTIESLNLIFENSKNSKLDFSGKGDIDSAIRYIAELFNTTHIQSCLFAIIFNFQMDDTEIGFERLLKFLGLGMTDYFDLKSDIKLLIDKRLIILKRDNNTKNLYNSSFTINQKVLDALFENKSIEDGLSESEVTYVLFCSHISRVIRQNSMRRLSIYELVELVTDIENRNQNLTAIKLLKELRIEIEERIILYSLSESLTGDNESMVNLSSMIKQIFGTESYMSVLSSFMTREQDLQLKELVKIESKGFVEDALIGLTTKGKTILLGDSATFYNIQVSTKHNLIRCESIVEKQLFFNEKLKSEIDFFKSSIRPENLLKLKEKLLESKIKKSIVTIFDGLPGSGKTESCYQIAKELGYDLFVMDFTQMKSAYYSESQKLVREAFDEYREVCKTNVRPVILLINECDGLLHQRISSADSHSSDQTENEIQTILLEEFEKSNDVIILTTNIIDNIDNAFYRRFLFKIRLDNPDKKVIKQIYQSKLPWLQDDELDKLSTIELSGGEIDNVVTKIVLHEVIHSEKPSLEVIRDFCRQEKVEKRKMKKLGFN